MIEVNIGTLISAGGAALAALAFVTAVFAMRAARRWRAHCTSLEASVAALHRELELVASISMRTGRQVKRIEHDYSGVADRVEVVELRGAERSFDQAIESARRGADPDKLTQQFGLSRGEADLVARLHGRQKGAQG
jgi:hypothetical protein